MDFKTLYWLITGGALLATLLFLLLLRSLYTAKIKEPVSGVLEVMGAPVRFPKATTQSGTIIGVLHAEGEPSREVSVTCMIRGSKLPSIGQRLPVTFCRRDPDQVRVEWDRVPTTQDMAMEMAKQHAAQSNMPTEQQWQFQGGASGGTLKEQIAEMDPERRQAFSENLEEMMQFSEKFREAIGEVEEDDDDGSVW